MKISEKSQKRFPLSGQGGSVLVILIVVIVFVACLGAAMAWLHCTMTAGQAESVAPMQALYNAYTGCACYDEGFGTGWHTLDNGQRFFIEMAGEVVKCTGSSGDALRTVIYSP